MDMQVAIRDAHLCHAVCVQTIRHCLTKGGRHAEPDHVTLLMDCAEICATAANFMLRDSRLHPQVCAACADACDACAASCAQMADEEQMNRCLQACQKCADGCRPHARRAASAA